MGKLNGRTAFISGVARGQGRSHALKLASEGADIIGFDLCGQIDSVEYEMSTPEDLQETVSLVESAGGRIVAEQADVRDASAVGKVLEVGLDRFGHVDIVLANAGVMPVIGERSEGRGAWHDAVDIMLTGVFNTVEAARPSMVARNQGGAIVITSSTAGLKAMPADSPGAMGYVAAKHGVVGLMRSYAQLLAPYFIRANTVHPTGVSTPMVANQQFMEFMMTHGDVAQAMQNAMPVPMVDAEDISNAVAWLVSDDAQYVTGVALPVDAGFLVR